MQLPLQMAGMAGRIAGVRGELQAALESRCPDKDWSFITKQIGMFSFTGMTPQQVRRTAAQLPQPARTSCSAQHAHLLTLLSV
jgi:aspartate/tyrosine/aromatic aminotransferase